jgi:hypothetical protein
VIKDASLKRESVAGDKIDEVIKIWDIERRESRTRTPARRSRMKNGARCEVQHDAFKDSRRMRPMMIMQE